MESSLKIAIKKLISTWKPNSAFTQSLKIVLKNCSHRNHDSKETNWYHTKSKKKGINLNNRKCIDETAISRDALGSISAKVIDRNQVTSTTSVLPSTFIKK